MGDKCNCYRFSPRDSLSGAVAQIADYLSKHPGWNETELRAFVDGLISSAGVETFNGRSGNVTLNKDDVNNLLIANCYFAEADETIESIDVLALYKLGIRIVFTKYSSEVDGYTLAYGIEYYPATDTAKAYLFSSGGGPGDIVSVNGKTGAVNLKVVDVSKGNSPDENAYIFIDESDDYPEVTSPDSNKLGGQLPSYYASAEEVSQLKSDITDVWSPTVIYKAGDYCIYNNVLYKCKTQNQNSVPPSTDWETCTISGELLTATARIADIQTKYNSLFAEGVTDLDNPPAAVLINTAVDPIGKPPELSGNGVFVIQHNRGQGPFCAQLAFGFGDFKMALRRKVLSNDWSQWTYIMFS